MRFTKAALVTLLQHSATIWPPITYAFSSNPKCYALSNQQRVAACKDPVGYSDTDVGKHVGGTLSSLFMAEFDLDLSEAGNDDVDLGVQDKGGGAGERGLAASILGVASVQLHASKVCLIALLSS